MKLKRVLLKGTIHAWTGLVFAAALFLYVDCQASARPEGPQDKAPAEYLRIVSLAPSITESLFLLGLGDRVVGVTRYCTYPAQARDKARIGGYCDPNYEAIMTLRPDLIVMSPEHDVFRRNLDRLGADILLVDHRDISGILESILAMGRVCGEEQAAAAVAAGLRERMDRVRAGATGLVRPRVLICVGRNMGSGRIGDIHIAGKGSFFDDLISLAGGVNAYCGDIAYPMVAREGLIRIDPEVIIDMVPDLDKKGLRRDTILEEWRVLGRVAAVRDNRVHVFGQDYAVVPGPRFILILEEMARAIHPEVGWR